MQRVISNENSIYLDLIRGVSAQIVLIGHLLSFYGFQERYQLPVIQNFGVVIFFVLSGFLITQTTILKGREYGFTNYLIDRFARIFFTFIPGLLLVLAIDLALIYYFKSYDPAFKFNAASFVANLLMLHPFPYIERLGIESFGSGRPFWTVGIEWWCYVFFGFMFYRSYSKYRLVTYLLFAISLVFILFNIQGRGVGLSLYWAFGFIMAQVFNKFQVRVSNNQLLVIFGLLVIAFLYRAYFYRDMYDAGLAALFGVMLFMLMSPNQALDSFAHNPLVRKCSTFIVSYSYSLYLVHYSVIVLMQQLLPEQLSLLNVFVIFVTTNLVAYLFHLLFEKNHFRFRRWLKKMLNQKETARASMATKF